MVGGRNESNTLHLILTLLYGSKTIFLPDTYISSNLVYFLFYVSSIKIYKNTRYS